MLASYSPRYAAAAPLLRLLLQTWATRHKTVGPDLHLCLARLLGKQIPVNLMVAVFKKKSARARSHAASRDAVAPESRCATGGPFMQLNMKKTWGIGIVSPHYPQNAVQTFPSPELIPKELGVSRFLTRFVTNLG
jgi:hypothetical protein